MIRHVLPAILSGGALIMSGCVTQKSKPANIPFHTLYRPINDAGAQQFLEQGIAVLRRDHAPLEFSVRQVLLRHAEKNEIGRGYKVREHFSLTEIVDAQQGIFAIYIAVPPSDPEFYPFLAHEIGHLKRPSVEDDWDMEGWCTVFSEKLCAELGKDWSAWTQRFKDNPKGKYARSYFKAKLENQ